MVNDLAVAIVGGGIPSSVSNIFGHDFQSFFQEINIAENKRRRMSRRADGGGPDTTGSEKIQISGLGKDNRRIL